MKKILSNNLLKSTTALILFLISFSGSFSNLHGQTLHEVITVGNEFSPSALTIQEGDTVRWTNSGMGFHNVLADDDSFRCANGCDGMGGNGDPSPNAWTFTLVFTSAGMVPYYCEIHGTPGGGGMAGTVTVEAPALPACTSLSSPANGATNVPANTTLTWTAASGNPTGYRLDVGTSPGGTDILNNFDVGNVTTFDPPGYLPYGTAIYVTIRPYNANGPANGCTEESFTTGSCIPNLNIVSMPVPAGTYRSLGDLISDNSTIANGTVVNFISNTGVLLDQNFVVEAGGVFEVTIQSCP